LDSTNGDQYITAGAVENLHYALYVKKVNLELTEHLNESLLWVLHYCKKHNIPLPDMGKIRSIIEKSIELEQKSHPHHPTTFDKENNRHGLYRTIKH